MLIGNILTGGAADVRGHQEKPDAWSIQKRQESTCRSSAPTESLTAQLRRGGSDYALNIFKLVKGAK